MAKNSTAMTINTFASFSIKTSYEMLAPMTKESPSEMVNEINPTDRLSSSISLSILNWGVKNSYKK